VAAFLLDALPFSLFAYSELTILSTLAGASRSPVSASASWAS
jgi:hypothetical protein